MTPKRHSIASSLLPALLLLTVGLLSTACGSSDAEDHAPTGASTSNSSTKKSSTGANASANTRPATKATPVSVVEVKPEPLDDTILATGELRADEQVDLRSEESGRIVELRFREGQRVRRGDLLLKVNDADLQAELKRVAVQKQLAEQREQRISRLLAERTVSQELYDEAKGKLDELEAQQQQLAARVRRTELRAPFSGIVGLRSVSEGSYVTPAQSIASLQRLDPIKVDFAIPEKYAGEINRGDDIEFTVSGQEGAHRGTVYAIEPRVDATTRTVQVRARAENPQESLLPGAFAEVRLQLGRQADALMVPSIALIPSLESTTVYVVENGLAQARRVRVGKRTEKRVQITDGLQAGDRVVVTGVVKIRPGSPVTFDGDDVSKNVSEEATDDLANQKAD